MKQIHIIDTHYRQSLLTNNTHMFNTSFLSFNQTFFNLNQKQKNHRFMVAYHLVNQHIDQFKHLKDVLNFPQTIEDTLAFLDECDQFEIDIKSIKTTNEIDKEKVKLLEFFDQKLSYRPYKKANQYDSAQLHFHHQYLTPFQFAFAKKRNLKMIKPSLINKPHIQSYLGLNPRSEIEALAQHFITHDIRNGLILCGDLDNYSHEIKRQFDYYGLQVQIQTETIPVFNQVFYHLVMYLRTNERKHIIPFLKLNPLNIKYSEQLADALELFDVSLGDDFNKVSDELYELFDRRPLNHLKTLQDQAKEAQRQLQAKLETIDTTSIETIFSHVFKLLSNTFEHHEVYALKNLLESIFDSLNNDTFDVLFKHMLLRKVQQPSTQQGFQVASFKELPPQPVEHLILCGVTTHSYPGFSENKGLFNENFTQHIDTYPSLISRIELHLTQLESLFSSSPHIIVSSPLMDYEGKAYERPLEIDFILQNHEVKTIKWPLQEVNQQVLEVKKLPSDLSKRLFFGHDDKLYGSISSFETYFKNSYQYFIEQGLKVRKKQPLKLDAALLGTITHSVMETIVKNFPDQYIDTSPETLHQSLQPLKSHFIKLYGKAPYVEFVFKRIETYVLFALEKMRPYQEATPYQPVGFEVEFSDYEHLIDGQRIVIKGIVDRIDGNDEEILVLDYKSSQHTMRPLDILNGKRLQLVTYGMILSELQQKKLMGIYYINMRPTYQNYTLTKHTMSQGITFNKPSLDNQDFRLVGMSFEIDEHHELSSVLRLKGQNRKNLYYDLNLVKKHFNLIYEHLYKALENGDILRYYNAQDSLYFEMPDLQRFMDTYKPPTTLCEYEQIDATIDYLLKGGN